jgi:hypothetical protein
MKATLVNRLSKQYLLSDLPSFSIKGHLLYSLESDYLLHGICFESSSFSSTSFTIEVFVQPLFIPSEYIYFSFGNRLGSMEKGYDYWWEYSTEDEETIMDDIKSIINSKGKEFFKQCKSLKGLILHDFGSSMYTNPGIVSAIYNSLLILRKYKRVFYKLPPFRSIMNFPAFYRRFGLTPNINSVEAICYSFILLGKFKEALSLLSPLKNIVELMIVEFPKIEWIKSDFDRIVLMVGFLESKNHQVAVDQLNVWRGYTLLNLKLS